MGCAFGNVAYRAKLPWSSTPTQSVLNAASLPPKHVPLSPLSPFSFQLNSLSSMTQIRILVIASDLPEKTMHALWASFALRCSVLLRIRYPYKSPEIAYIVWPGF